MDKETKTDLMQPRYKVIADYPEIERHNIKQGDIITRMDNAMQADYLQDGTPVVAIDHEIFPANFKKLEWWEERKDSDLPEYVRQVINQDIGFTKKGTESIYKISYWKNGTGYVYGEVDEYVIFGSFYEDSFISNEQEYNEYQKQKA